MKLPPGRTILTVGELTDRVLRTLEQTFPSVWVKGELSEFTRHSSGHWYFSLKDDRATLRCVMFKFQNRYIRFRPEEGMEVLCRGKISGYAPRGVYQLTVQHLEPLGLGALYLEFERLKEKLKSEGLFDPARKRPIPTRPGRIAIVTSPQAAALQDMLTILGQRDPGMDVLIIPARVQGEGAAAELAAALALANRPEVAYAPGRRPLEAVIVGRGGGSIEDLWAFNEEALARAIAGSALPVISAVGHEVDFTIADFVADLRAATPTAAAEIVAAGRAEQRRRLELAIRRLPTAIRHRLEFWERALAGHQRLLADPGRRILEAMIRVDDLSARMARGVDRSVSDRANRLLALARALSAHEPRRRLATRIELLELHRARLQAAGLARLEAGGHRLERTVARLQALSPLATLSRGYAIARDEQGKALRDAKEARVGQGIEVILHQGRLGATVSKIEPGSDDLD